MKHPRDSLAGAALGEAVPSPQPQVLAVRLRETLGGPAGWSGETKRTRANYPAFQMQTPCLLAGGSVLVRTGPGWEEPAVLLQMHLPQIPVRAQDQRRASTAFSSPERGRHGTPGLDRTQAFELSPARPQEAPFGPTCP